MDTGAIIFLAFFCLVFLAMVFGDKDKNKKAATARAGGKNDAPKSGAIADNFRNLAEVEVALRKAGLESSDLILAVDFTKSNSWQGEKTFGGRNLHSLSAAPGEANPYQQVIDTLSDVLLKKLDDDCSVPLYGFGDRLTANRRVFLLNNEALCHSKEELLCAYADAAAEVVLAGPTSFAPIILEAVDVAQFTGKYHVLVIMCDGMCDDVQETIKAIITASNHPISIVCVGVGDGPWDQMENFDDDIPVGTGNGQRKFDNFQFVSYTQLTKDYADLHKRSVRFALESLMELPEQYAAIKKAGLLGKAPNERVQFTHRLTGQHRFASSFQADQTWQSIPGGMMPPSYNPAS